MRLLKPLMLTLMAVGLGLAEAAAIPPDPQRNDLEAGKLRGMHTRDGLPAL